MHRELNPQLFGNQTPLEDIGRAGTPAPPPGARVESAAVPYPPNEIKSLEHQIGTLKVALLQMEKRTETIGARLEEMTRSVHARLERFSQAIVRLEESQNESQQNTTGKLAQIVAKVNERKVTDQKVHELIDRHNLIIRNFENRLHSLQRLISEQEMTLHNSNAALEETRAELTKLRGSRNLPT